jgi:hypothetical protein
VGIRTAAAAWAICTKPPSFRRKALEETLGGLFFGVLPADDETRRGLGDAVH